MTFHVFMALSAFLLSLLGTRIAILAMRNRRNRLGYEKLPPVAAFKTPTAIGGGGIVVVFAIIICLAVADIRYGILLSMFLLCAVSLLGNLIPIPWLVRMLVQIIAIAIPLSVLEAPTFGGILPPWVDTLATGALWLWFINMFNGMDDVDGLCATGMICLGFGLSLPTIIEGIFPNVLATYSLIVASAGCGFLWWNWSPAKITMGSAGCIPIGFLLGYLLLLAIHGGYGFAVIILPAYYVSDSAISWIRRTWADKPLQLSHTDHYYQRALHNGRKPKSIVRLVFGIHLLLIFLATYALIDPELQLFHISMAYLCVFMLLGFFAHTKPTIHGRPHA